ncbi:hypothetical protein [Streptomyces sp. NBC_00842]|uniref:aromatic-ring hydroxylase C-terminal domain-containing protein n=1 Tax=unclassified Streptomyces TaxID=2593676 RepID=UPI00386FD86D
MRSATSSSSYASNIAAHWTSDCAATLLVRPDGYVAWASDRPDPAALQTALTR